MVKRRAQISAELIIVMAALVGVAIILISQMRSTAHEAEDLLDKKSDQVINQVKKI